MRMNVTLRQLRVFCAVYERRSFTAAAEEMHMTQSAASKLCAELESEIGLPLFERTTRRVVPRDGAAELYGYAQEVLNTMRLAGRRLTALRSLESGEVSIASSPMTMYGIISDVIERFIGSHPKVGFDLHELSTDETIEYVKTGRCDFGIVSTTSEDPQLSARVVYSHPLVLACSVRHALGRRAEVDWSEVAEYEHIALRSVYSTRTTVDRILRAKGLALKSSIQAGTLATALKLSAANLGLTLIPRYARAAAIERGLRVIKIKEDKANVHELSMVTRRGLKPSIAAAAFMKELERELLVRSSDAV
jgi:DNA-binding transcriptional LysR family regulator